MIFMIKLLGNFALEIPSMDELMDIPTQQLLNQNMNYQDMGNLYLTRKWL